MTRNEMLDLVGAMHLGRLACARNGQPFITPLNFALEGDYLYAFSSVGRKIHWMRENPLVCVAFDHIESAEDWLSVVVDGLYEEISSAPDGQDMREHAYQLLRGRPVWWEPAYVKTILHAGERSLEPIYFRVRITGMSGHCGVPDALSQPQQGLMDVLRRVRDRLRPLS